jgi:hypothetical protein
MTRADRLLIAAVALMALIAWPLVALAGGPGVRAVVEGPQGSSVLVLGDDEKFEVEGTTGTVAIRVAGGRVAIVESGCPDHTCVKTGAISAAGSVVACVPNGVVVRVQGAGDDDGFDARVR